MANKKSVKKAHRASARKRVFNERRKRAVKRAVREIAARVTRHHAKEAEAMLPALYMAVDKAAKRGVIKKRTAARIKSRISKRIARLTK